MKTGIIYQAKNLINGKIYIGQTTYTLNHRKTGHYEKCSQYKHKFANALRKYSKEDWEWSVLAEVEIDKLDDLEIVYIEKYDTLKNGYNTVPGGKIEGKNHHRYSDKIYKIWHPKYNFLFLTRSELVKINKCFSHSLQRLISGEYKQINGFVLAENKDKYNEIINPNIYKFFHSEFGQTICSASDLCKKYNLKYKSITNLTGGYTKKVFGWELLEIINQKPNNRRKNSIDSNNLEDVLGDIKKELNLKLEKEKFYSGKEIKNILKETYQIFKVYRKGKATDILLFFNGEIEYIRINGIKTYGFRLK